MKHYTTSFDVHVTKATLIESGGKAKDKVGLGGSRVYITYTNNLVPPVGPHSARHSHAIVSLKAEQVECLRFVTYMSHY